MDNKNQRLWQLDLSRNDDLALALVLSAGARPLRDRLSEILILREELAITLASLHPIIFGIMFILIVLLFPCGLVDIWT